jgi:hypothetical protein
MTLSIPGCGTDNKKDRAVPKVIGTARWCHCDPSFCHPEPFDMPQPARSGAPAPADNNLGRAGSLP